MGRRCLPFTFPSNVFNFARPAYCRRNKSKSLSALRDPGLFLFCAPPLAAASWARKKRRIPDAEKVVSFFSCFLRNSPLASHLVPPESLANPHFSHFLPSHPALSRISQLSCLFTSAKIEATSAQAGAKVAVAFNGENVRNGGTVKLTNGAGNVVTVTVTQGNAVRVYTVTITATIGG